MVSKRTANKKCEFSKNLRIPLSNFANYSLVWYTVKIAQSDDFSQKTVFWDYIPTSSLFVDNSKGRGSTLCDGNLCPKEECSELYPLLALYFKCCVGASEVTKHYYTRRIRGGI